MRTKSLATKAAAGAVAAAAALALAACGSSSTGSSGSSTGLYGGTLHVLMHGTMTTTGDTLEPANSWSQESVDMLPLIYSPLTIYVPGSNPTQIVGDLATTGGVSSDGARVWTYHIRHGVDYSSGTQVTSYDVKYAVERSYAPQFAGGSCGPNLNLIGQASYKGPYADKSGLASIETPNASTISFHLAAPNYDFNYLTTSPCFSGVPQAKDTITKYGNNPVTSGPYEIQSFQGGKSLVLTRNPHWKRGLVPTINAYPDEIDYSLGLDPSVIDQRLITDQSSDQDAIATDSAVQASDVAQVLNNPQVKSRSSDITLGANEYMLFMNDTKAPFNNPLVRQAMQYAVNKQSFQTATGGPIAGGPIAQSLLGPGILGYSASYKPYPAPATGDPAKAKALLAQAGYQNQPITLTMPSGSSQNTNQATALKDALSAAGFNVKLQMVDSQAYNTEVFSEKSAPALFMMLLGGNWNDAGQVLGMYDSTMITPSVDYDLPQIKDPALDKLIHQGQQAASATAAAPIWAKVNEALMKNASVVPIMNESKIYLHGSGVQGDVISNVYGAPTLFDISVSH